MKKDEHFANEWFNYRNLFPVKLLYVSVDNYFNNRRWEGWMATHYQYLMPKYLRHIKSNEELDEELDEELVIPTRINKLRPKRLGIYEKFINCCLEPYGLSVGDEFDYIKGKYVLLKYQCQHSKAKTKWNKMSSWVMPIIPKTEDDKKRIMQPDGIRCFGQYCVLPEFLPCCPVQVECKTKACSALGANLYPKPFMDCSS
jgi:hypothetical protein